MMFKTDEQRFDLCSVHYISDCLKKSKTLFWYISKSGHHIRGTKCVRKDINHMHTFEYCAKTWNVGSHTIVTHILDATIARIKLCHQPIHNYFHIAHIRRCWTESLLCWSNFLREPFIPYTWCLYFSPFCFIVLE